MKKNKVNKKYIKKSFKFFKDVKGKLLVLTLFYIFLGVIGFIGPMIQAKLITSITLGDVQNVIFIASTFLVVIIVQEIFRHFVLTFWRKKIRPNILFNIRKELVDNVLELRLSNFDKYQTGIFQERVKNDPQIITRVVNVGQRYLLQCFTKVGVIIYVMYINWILGLIYLSGVIIVAIIDLHTQEKSKEKNKQARKSDEEVNTILSEIVRGIRDVKLLNFKNSIKELLMKKLDENNDISVDKDNYDSLTDRIKKIVLIITVFIVVVVGIKFVNLGLLTSANLVVLYLYNGNIFSLMENFSWLRSSLKEYELAIERIFDLEDNSKYPKDKFGKVKKDDIKGKIEFDNVDFGYDEDKLVLNNLSFIIEPKDTVAIVGASGSGKTTVFNMLTGVYTPTDGTVKLEGKKINGMKPYAITRLGIARTFQNIRLFKDMTVKENVLAALDTQANYGLFSGMFKLPNSLKQEKDMDQEAMSLLEVFHLEKDADKLAKNLPYGKQRELEIIRALGAHPKLLLLDEPAAGMNPQETKNLMETIRLVRDRFNIAILLIEHDMKLVMGICEKISVLNYGMLLAEGTPEEIRTNPDVVKAYLGE